MRKEPRGRGKLQVALNAWAREAFRDQADQDYIAARDIYRLEFREQFLWSGLQAIEKHLKAILLYNGVSSRYKNWPATKGPEFNHDIAGLLKAVGAVPEIEFSYPDSVAQFVDYLNRLGTNRYYDRSTYTVGDELHKLDEAVWHIRRYCQNLHFEVDDPVTGTRDVVAEQAAWLNSSELLEKPWQFRLRGGLLERILCGGSSRARDALVWKNLYYGSRGKNEVAYPALTGSANPPNVRPWASDPKLRSELEKYVKLS